MSEKIQKVLARAGLGSRREIETWIEAGRIKVGGAISKLGDRIEDGQTVFLDGRPLKLLKAHENRRRVLLYNKPEGEVATRKDPEGRPTVFDRLPRIDNQRWINVGRLDINTSGLMLFTTDGELANKLMHPSSNIDREYLVRLFGEVTDEIVQRLLSGVELEDGPARFSDVVENEEDSGQNRWYTVCLMEGRNREVRRLWESQGIKVNRLKRVRFGPVFLPSYLRTGQWVDMDVAETKSLYRQCGLRTPELNMRQPRERVKSKRQEQKLRSGGRSANRH